MSTPKNTGGASPAGGSSAGPGGARPATSGGASAASVDGARATTTANDVRAHQEEETPAPDSKTMDRVIAVFVLLLTVGLLVASFNFPPTAQLFDPGTAALPRLVVGALLVLGLVLLLKPEAAHFLEPGGSRPKLLASVVLTGIATFLVDPVGFPLTLALFMLAGLLVMGVRNPIGLIVVPIAVSLGLFYLFTVALSVYLPAGVLDGVLP